MKRTILALILVLLGTASRAQVPQDLDKCAVAGVVVKSTTGAPLKRAVIFLQRIGTTANNEQYSLRTDAAGRFSFSELAPGDYVMWANRDGYANMSYGQESPEAPPKPLTLKPGERKTDLLFRLVPLGDIVGHVYDEDGEPVSGVNVQALQYNYFNGRRQLAPSTGSGSDDVGAYRLARLTPGEYYLSATYNEPAASDQAAPVSYVPVYYPGTTDLAAAQPVRVGTGQESPEIDFTLVPVRSVSIRGRVIHTEAWRPVGLNVGLLRRDADVFSYQGNATADPQGNFEIRSVPPGSYVLNVQYYDRGRQYSGRQTVEVGNSDVDGVELVLGPGSEIRGYVRLEGKGALDLKGMQVQLVPREQFQMGAQPATVAADGSFALQNVPDGPYLIGLCCLPPDFYLKTVHLGSEDALANGVNLSQAQPAGSLELIVSPAGGEIQGVVLNEDKPASFATVVLVPDSDLRTQTMPYPTTGLSADGRFTLTSIPPGDYSMFALERADNVPYLDPEFLHTYAQYGKPIRVEEGSKLSVQLELIRNNDGRPQP